MAKELVFTETFKENYKRLDSGLQKRFGKKLLLFVQNPLHPSLQIHKYHATENVWEGYVTHKYRFTFSVTKDSYIFRNIGPHDIIDKGKI